MPDLFVADDLAGLPGAPFEDEAVTQAGEAIRNALGWHLAPSVEETLTVDSPGGVNVYLKTKYLTDVAEVRDVTAGTVLTGWTFTRLGRMRRRSGWPCDHVLEFDVTHGLEDCPDELLPIGAAIARSGSSSSNVLKARTAGPFREEYADGFSQGQMGVLDTYKILYF